MQGKRERADAAGRRALALATAQADPIQLWQVHQLLAALADLSGGWRSALDCLDACAQWPEPGRLSVLQARANALLGTVLKHRGQWTEALAALGRAIDAQREMGLQAALPAPLVEAALIYHHRGNAGTAHDYLEEARTIVETQLNGRAPALAAVMLALGEVSLETGRPEQARDYALHAAGALGCDRCGGLAIAGALALRARAEIAMRDLSAAERALIVLQRLAWAAGHAPTIAEYWEARGQLALVRNDLADAVAAFRESAEAWAALERPFEEGRARTALGEALRGTDDPAAAPALERAWALLEPLGVEPALKGLRRGLAGLGVAVHLAKVPARVGPVTERERELIDLIGRRYPTDQIAKRLVISPATVRTHVRNIFRKLGVSSRGELVRVARDQGLVV
jgi:DNA-binding CsgD family transcriptional regulator